MKIIHSLLRKFVKPIAFAFVLFAISACSDDDLSKITVPQEAKSVDVATKIIEKRAQYEIARAKKIAESTDGGAENVEKMCKEAEEYTKKTKGNEIHYIVEQFIYSAAGSRLSSEDKLYLRRLSAEYYRNLDLILNSENNSQTKEKVAVTSRPDISVDLLKYYFSNSSTDLLRGYGEFSKESVSATKLYKGLKIESGDLVYVNGFVLEYLNKHNFRKELEKAPLTYSANNEQLDTQISIMKRYLASLLSHSMLDYESVYLRRINYYDCVEKKLQPEVEKFLSDAKRILRESVSR